MTRHSKINLWFRVWLGTPVAIILKAVLVSWLFTTCSSPAQRSEEDAVLERVWRCAAMPEERINTTALVVEDVQRVMQERWPGSKAFPFGALVANVGTRGSDFDCFVRLPADSEPSKLTVLEARDLLASHPQLFSDLGTVHEATVPIVRFKHLPTGHRCDVNFLTMENVVQTQVLKHMLQDDRARQLAVVLKQWLTENKPTIARRVMPNYALVLLVVFYLQQRRLIPSAASLQQHADSLILDHWQMGYRPIPYTSTDDATLFQLLTGFFQFYSHFDFENKIVSPFTGTAIDRTLFEKLDTIPPIFDNYKRNIALNVTRPLNMTTPVCVQNLFNHRQNKAAATTPELLEHFRKTLKHAAEVTTNGHSLMDIFGQEECYFKDENTNIHIKLSKQQVDASEMRSGNASI